MMDVPAETINTGADMKQQPGRRQKPELWSDAAGVSVVATHCQHWPQFAEHTVNTDMHYNKHVAKDPLHVVIWT